MRFLSFHVQPVIVPLVGDPFSWLGFAVVLRTLRCRWIAIVEQDSLSLRRRRHGCPIQKLTFKCLNSQGRS
jgi:hypothetical protein